MKQRESKDSGMNRTTSKLWDTFTLVTGLACNGGHRGELGGRKIFEEILAKYFPNLRKTINPSSKMLAEPQIEETCRKLRSHSKVKLLRIVIKGFFNRHLP